MSVSFFDDTDPDLYDEDGELTVGGAAYIDALDRMINNYPRSVLTPDAYLKIGETHADFLGACALYEDAYFHFMEVIEHDVQTSLGMFKAATGESESQQSGRAILALPLEIGRAHV